MTEKEHPITPPPKLVEQWSATIYRQTEDDDQRDLYIATQAARWGADQELEACCEWINSFQNKFVHAHDLRLVRRPKPPSLKEQALEALDAAVKMADDVPPEGICSDQANIIRRALEQLPDNE